MKLFLTAMSALLLSCLSGCGTSEHAEAHDDDHHLEHFVPHHKPANFAQAVEEIEHRAEHLSEHAGHGHDDEADEFQELLDVVDWIPELAADSDLNEADWTTAITAAAAVKKTLEASRATDGGLDLKQLPDAITAELKSLEALIPAAGKPEKRIEHGHNHDHHHDHDHDHEHEHDNEHDHE